MVSIGKGNTMEGKNGGFFVKALPLFSTKLILTIEFNCGRVISREHEWSTLLSIDFIKFIGHQFVMAVFLCAWFFLSYARAKEKWSKPLTSK